MGMGATDILGRVAASLGQSGPNAPSFQAHHDVPNGGVLFSLPSLLANGLLHNITEYFQELKGYYRLDSIFLMLSFCNLSRIKSIESLRYCAPGEWGKILGLDRIPEVKTIRDKIKDVTDHSDSRGWINSLSCEWINAHSQIEGLFYVDGHVRVYHGDQTVLPKHYVARQKLCLRATTDYWVNALDGQPFYLVNQEIDPGLLQVMDNDIVPHLESILSQSPTESVDNRPRFTLVFDREGYSPDFFRRMRSKNIACLTYHKFPGDHWSLEEFQTYQVQLVSGCQVEMKLAERGSFIGKKIWVREIRKLTKSGHQTSIITTNYAEDICRIASLMFARWVQENYFKYMRENFNIDKLFDYTTEEIPETKRIVNPAYREITTVIRKVNSQLTRNLAKYASLELKEDIKPGSVEKYLHVKSELQEVIDHLQHELRELKEKKKTIPSHITVSELPEELKFKKLGTTRRQLIEAIKMISYRAETSMVNIIREDMSRGNEARRLLQAVYQTEADIIPDYANKQLHIILHNLANRSGSEIIKRLCDELNETETTFPGTELKICYGLLNK
ncbi:MAG: hypothetical protein H8E14_00485 [Candidatus Marinimicrobia bacterium]|nr:hypothetical protein [Candidatus Neomarinimicrobiota bacterium]